VVTVVQMLEIYAACNSVDANRFARQQMIYFNRALQLSDMLN